MHTIKRIILCTLTCVLLAVPLVVHADTTVDIGKPSGGNSGTEPGGGGGGGSSGGEEPGPPPGDYVPKLPNELLVTPKVTALHSLNALLAQDMDGKDLGVYFVPSLEDFPVNLKDTASYVVDYNNVIHQFAAVYDGYFDTEVEYVAATNTNADSGEVGRLQTSKKVYSSVDNTRTLNMLGYDLLLSNETVQVSNNGKALQATYKPTLVGTQELNTETIVMDLYKALREDEWDIKFIWVEDPELKLDTSPIQGELNVAISDKLEDGIDTSEGKTYVWATRTNPELYWNKAKKDAIFDGGAHSVTNTRTQTYVGSEVSVSFSKSRVDSVTFGEFCSIARAMMDLYGEPVMTAQEQLVMIQSYGLTLPSCDNEEVYQSVSYLAAKGIINPEDTDFSKLVTFADIEPILVRIADKDSRLTFKETDYNPNSELFQRGYVSAKTSMSAGLIEDIDQVNSSTTTKYNDFFVECDDSMTNFILTNTEETVLASDNIKCNGFASASTDNWYSPDTPIDNVYPFEFKGVENNFYHFKVAEDVTNVTISYERDLSRSEYTLNRESYTLPNADGGVYLVENGSWVHYGFDEAVDKVYTTMEKDMTVEKALPQYSLYYIDNTRRSSGLITEMSDFGYMSTYNWVYMTLDNAGKAELAQYTYDGITLSPLQAMASGDVITIDNPTDSARIYVKYIATSDVSHTYIFQVPYGQHTFMQRLTHNSNATFATSNAYFRSEDNSVLVSYDFLKSKGLVTSMQKLSQGEGYVLTLSNMKNTNVILRKDLGIIIVGSTLYKTNELLYHEAAGKAYINYRACLGWTYDYLVLNNNGNIQLTASSKMDDLDEKTFTATSFYPTSSVGIQGFNYSGNDYVSLSALNPLGNYLLVSDTDNNTDFLFMWKRKEYALPNDSTKQSYGDDGDARSKFKDLTGISLSTSSDYVLFATSLMHKDYNTSVGDFLYVQQSRYGIGGTTSTVSLGWLYRPQTHNSFNEAASTYLNTNSASMLPIAKVGSRYLNLNLNMCSITPVDDILPYGQMPKKYAVFSTKRLLTSSSNKGNQKVSLIDSTKSPMYVDSSATYKSVSDSVIHPAPVGMFSELYGLPSATVGQLSNQSKSVYYGSQLLRIDKVKGTPSLLLGPNKVVVESSESDTLHALAIGSGTNAMYSYGIESAGVNQELSDNLDSVTSMLTEANKLIDWDAFTFKRLVKQIDEWSSIALIFVLNVMPRIGMVLLFLLIILSLAKTWRPWIKFCHSFFDIYKILSIGSVTVDTVNTSRLVFQSMLGLSLFMMMIDGLLFNFILWVSKFILLLAQR